MEFLCRAPSDQGYRVKTASQCYKREDKELINFVSLLLRLIILNVELVLALRGYLSHPFAAPCYANFP